MANQSRIRRNVRVSMRDGAVLAADVYLPPGEGPFPVVLVRTAYNRTNYYDGELLASGIAFVVQDCRGRYDAEGEFFPFLNEVEDGTDTLDWLAVQPWCNGRIGMYGDSYLGGVQYAVGQTGHPALAALNPRFMPGDGWKHEFYVDGVFSLALTWSYLCFEGASRVSQAALLPRFDVPALLRQLPVIALDKAFGSAPLPVYRAFLQHNRYDAFWEDFDYRRDMRGYRAPVLVTGGWYDNYAGEAAATYAALVRDAPSAALRDGHRLLIGPWTHGVNATPVLGDLDFGPEALRENDHTFRWLDALLHGGAPADVLPAPVRLFVMGANRWRDEAAWPPARAQATRFYLRAGGGLTPEEPPASAPPDRYAYDPADPAPTRGGNHSVGPYNPGLYEHALPGPYDQRRLEARPDVLVYTSDVLREDTEVTGPVTVTLYAASSARDTDFVARLTDVYPDGRSINITEGVIRARFRDDVWGVPQLLEPGTIYRFTIDLQATSTLFKAGHRLRVQVTSSNFPLWDRNLNTGNDPATDTEMQVAEQAVYCDAEHPSHVTLPVLR